MDFLDPNQILDQIELKKDMIAADLGSGGGGWAIPLAKRLEDGKVLAVDVQEAPLSALNGRADLHKLSNIVAIIADVEHTIPGVEDDSCDLVLLTNLLFQVEDRPAVFREAKRILKRGGHILLVEWNENAPFGPKENKISQSAVEEIIQQSGLYIKKGLQAGDCHYGLLLAKP